MKADALVFELAKNSQCAAGQPTKFWVNYVGESQRVVCSRKTRIGYFGFSGIRVRKITFGDYLSYEVFASRA